MRIAIFGGHGKVAMRLTVRLLAREISVVSLIRNPAHADDIRALGAEPIVCDLERASVPEIAEAIAGADVAVFAAGAGLGSGPERKLTIDRDGAIKLLEASVTAEVPRFLIVSSVGAESPPAGEDTFSVYLRAKAEADRAVQASDRDWTIVRPGRLTDEPGRERVRIDTEPFRGEIAREDVAAVLDAIIQTAQATRIILYLAGGEQSVQEALEAVLERNSSGS
jgi:nucleoside-diphosphate-sugar epimerase